MSLDQLSRYFDEEMASVPDSSGSLKNVKRRAWRRRVARRAVSAGTVLLVVVVSVSFLVPTLPRIAAADGPDAPTRLLIDGDIEIPVTDEPVAEVENHTRVLTVYGGLPSPEPVFDTGGLGTEQPLTQIEPSWDATVDPGDVPVVYIGDVGERSVFVHTNGGISALDRLVAMIEGSEIGPHICMSIGEGETLGGGGFCGGPFSIPEHRATSGPLHINGPEGGYVGDYVAWFGLPKDTAVVTLEHENGQRLWQQPFGETALFDLDGPQAGQVLVSALDSDGNTVSEIQLEVHRYETSSAVDEEVDIPSPGNN